MSLYKIPTPNLSLISNPRKEFISREMYRIYFDNNLERYSDEKYLAWEKVKYLEVPVELESAEELWYIIRSVRYGRSTPIKNLDGKYFKLKKVNFLEELLHNLDLSLGGNFLDTNLTKNEQKIFLQNGIAEEAISSSQLE